MISRAMRRVLRYSELKDRILPTLDRDTNLASKGIVEFTLYKNQKKKQVDYFVICFVKWMFLSHSVICPSEDRIMLLFSVSIETSRGEMGREIKQ